MKRTVLAGAAVVTAAAGIGLARRHHRVAAAAPELRNPALYVSMSLRNDAMLRVLQHLIEAGMTAPPPLAGVKVRTDHVPAAADRPPVRVLVYERDDRIRPSGALVWIHGGGLVMGVPELGHDLCGRFARELGVVAVNVDYRLAPDHPFPAGLDDCHAALAWVHEQADALGIDPNRIAVGGDSAGGGLAACVAQMAHDRGELPVCFQLLQYPMLDDRTALRTDLDALVWSRASNRYAWSAYLGHPATEDESRPYASAARRADFTGLPPAWIGVGDIDLFHDECVGYADRLRAAGVPCDLHVVPGMYHGADRFVPGAASIRAFVDEVTRALGAAMSVRA